MDAAVPAMRVVVDAAPPRPKIDPAALARDVAEAKKLLKKRKAAKAIALLEQVLAKDPNHADARKLLGKHYAKQCLRSFDRSKFKITAELGRKAVTYQPKNAEVWVRIGWSLEKLKRKNEAKFALQRALELCPRCQWARFARQKLNKLK
jgi:Flp pilus assembly protein TadD